MEAAFVIELIPMGNLANRLIQYLVALEMQQRIPGSVLSNVKLPEINVVVPELENNLSSEWVLALKDDEYLDVQKVALLAKCGAIRHIRLWNYCQRIDNFPPPDTCWNKLSVISEVAGDVVNYGDEFIVVNIRASEILDGIIHYPLLPTDFYQDIV